MPHSIHPLGQQHDVSGFRCGVPALDTWLRNTARQHQAKRLSQTFVLVDDAAPLIVVGYYALAVRGLVDREALPEQVVKRLPRRLPGYTVARLAVHSDLAGRGLGALLLADAITRARHVSAQAGGPFLFVDAKDQQGAGFYRKFGFLALPDHPTVLVLRLG